MEAAQRRAERTERVGGRRDAPAEDIVQAAGVVGKSGASGVCTPKQPRYVA